jgi:hypothetical protein
MSSHWLWAVSLKGATMSDKSNEKLTASQKIQKSINTQLRARVSLFWIITPEERRALTGIVEAAGEAGYETRIWNCSKGLRDADGKILDASMADSPQRIATSRERAVRACDLHCWPTRSRSSPSDLAPTCRAVSAPRRAACSCSTSREVPPDYEGLANVIEWPRPDKAAARAAG